jgi:putative redox protein
MANTPAPLRSVSTWLGAGAFEHRPGSGHAFVTDARLPAYPEAELRGPTPMEMLLGATAGCTGLDIILVLSKMRLEIRTLRITAEGERREEHPRAFRRIRLNYEIETAPPDPEQIRRAVELSVTKYCSVTATLVAGAEMSYTLRCHGEEYEGTIPRAG